MADASLNRVERACKNCGALFTFPKVGLGLAKLHCSSDCQREFSVKQLKKRVAGIPCRHPDCKKPANRVGQRLCETHYHRLRRTGTIETRPIAGYKMRGHGYMARKCKDHPVSSSNGLLYEHREVLFNAIGEGAHSCHWCSKEIEWFAKDRSRMLVVDHLDGDKINNCPTNLVPSCLGCNGSRGLFQAWAMRHRDDPFMLQMMSEIVAGWSDGNDRTESQ